MTLVIIDTETTDLTKAEGTRLDFQPYMTEIYCLKVNKKLKKIDSFHSLFKIPIPVPKFITKITGISDYDLQKAPKFVEMYHEFAKFFTGVDTMVAHNLPFDLKILRYSLARIGKEYNFPYPRNHYCTVEHSLHLKGYRLKNNELYELATGKKSIKNAHRAKNDVLATFKSYKWLLKQEKKQC